MDANEILAKINDEVDFETFKYWTRDDVVEWVHYNFPCTFKVAKDVAYQLWFVIR